MSGNYKTLQNDMPLGHIYNPENLYDDWKDTFWGVSFSYESITIEVSLINKSKGMIEIRNCLWSDKLD